MKKQTLGRASREVVNPGGHRNRLIRGRGEFAGGESGPIPTHEIRKGATDIDTQSHLSTTIRAFITQTRRIPMGLGDKKEVVIIVEGTPNPNAVKFTVGKPVGGPATFVAGKPTDNAVAQALLALEGVTSVFLTADFVTVSKQPDADWSGIVPAAQAILEEHFV